MWAYDSGNADDLKFDEGDVIDVVLEEDEDGWMKGSLNGASGKFAWRAHAHARPFAPFEELRSASKLTVLPRPAPLQICFMRAEREADLRLAAH